MKRELATDERRYAQMEGFFCVSAMLSLNFSFLFDELSCIENNPRVVEHRDLQRQLLVRKLPRGYGGSMPHRVCISLNRSLAPLKIRRALHCETTVTDQSVILRLRRAKKNPRSSVAKFIFSIRVDSCHSWPLLFASASVR
jgi:hypothetical protein